MIQTINISMQFNKTLLFENVSLTFLKDNRYGIVGANGSGKSTFMKILNRELEPTSGKVSIDLGIKISQLNQNHFAYEKYTVKDTIFMGHPNLLPNTKAGLPCTSSSPWRVHAPALAGT